MLRWNNDGADSEKDHTRALATHWPDKRAGISVLDGGTRLDGCGVAALAGFQVEVSTVQQTHLASKSANVLKALLVCMSGMMLLLSPPFKFISPNCTKA